MMYVTCINEHRNKDIEVGKTYPIINADMLEYEIKIDDEKEAWIGKDDIDHFKYSV